MMSKKNIPFWWRKRRSSPGKSFHSCSRNRNYVGVTIPLPAGLEGINFSLETEDQSLESLVNACDARWCPDNNLWYFGHRNSVMIRFSSLPIGFLLGAMALSLNFSHEQRQKENSVCFPQRQNKSIDRKCLERPKEIFSSSIEQKNRNNIFPVVPRNFCSRNRFTSVSFFAILCSVFF